MKLLNELTEKYSKEGYEGKYLMCAVYRAALIIAAHLERFSDAEYFLLRLKQTEKLITPDNN